MNHATNRINTKSLTKPARRPLKIATALLLGLCPLLASTSYAASNYLQRSEYNNFRSKMVAEHGFKADDVERLFKQVKPQQKIIDAMTRPAEGLPWYKYRPIFLKEARIKGGVKFWKENAALLAKVEATYGVPPEIIVAIIGVETRYGQYTGKHRVIDAVATLGFDYPKRGAFFTSELEQFLLLAREEGLDPLGVYGSYAGAMGMPQFISSSYRNYAVDFNGNGKRDLFSEKADIIGSVANYFVRHGWKPGEPVALPARAATSALKMTTDDDRKPPHTVASLTAAGVRYKAELPPSMPADLLKLQAGDGKNNSRMWEYWLTLDNFYVITRYNHSPLYAMAVWQLASEIKKQAGLSDTSIATSSKATATGTISLATQSRPRLAFARYRRLPWVKK